MPLHFNEKQRFTQWWLWLALMPLILIPFIALYNQFIRKIPFGTNPTANLELILICVLMWALVVLFIIIRLITTIDNEGIHMRFFPLLKRSWKWEEIKSVKPIQYGFVGGWGIRLWTPYGTVYNIKGNQGLAIELKSGKKIMIGTQQLDVLTEQLQAAGKIN